LLRARAIAREAGLRYVYVGNVHDPEADSTWCPGCGRCVIERDWYQLGAYHLTEGACDYCGTTIPGIFPGTTHGYHGPERRPVTI
jgi:pyruvate formate lyase activating enzyme